MSTLDGPGPATRSPARLVSARLLGAAALGLAAFVALVALGTWQVHRLSWKLALIARVDARVHAPPQPPPGPADWSRVTAGADAYRHVTIAGTFLNDRTTLVQATTDYGAGYWVLTPLGTATDGIVLVNRGFVPSDEKSPADRREIAGPTVVTGLLRVSEPKGFLLRRNDPAADRWSSRDVAAIAAKRGLADVAPYFIDAEAGPGPTAGALAGASAISLPIAGLTVVSFPNNHLVYAFTWYALAAMLAGAGAWFAREEWRSRRSGRPLPQGQPSSAPR